MPDSPSEESSNKTKPVSLVPEYDGYDSDAMSDTTMLSSRRTGFGFGTSGDSSSQSDGRSIHSFGSSVDREFILKDVHGRVLNNTNEVRAERTLGGRSET